MFKFLNPLYHYKKRCQTLYLLCKQYRKTLRCSVRRSAQFQLRCETLEAEHSALKIQCQQAERIQGELLTVLNNVKGRLQAQKNNTEDAVEKLTVATTALNQWKDAADFSTLKKLWLDTHCHTLNHQNYGDGQFYELWEQRQRAAVRAFLADHRNDLTEADITYVKQATYYQEDESVEKGHWHYDVEENDVHWVPSMAV